jgi:hypothetical protein
MTPGTPGQRGWIVEHDPGSGEPKPGGRIIGAVVTRVSVNGGTEAVADRNWPGTPAEFLPGGWTADGTRRWRLVSTQTLAVMLGGASLDRVMQAIGDEEYP